VESVDDKLLWGTSNAVERANRRFPRGRRASTASGPSTHRARLRWEHHRNALMSVSWSARALLGLARGAVQRQPLLDVLLGPDV